MNSNIFCLFVCYLISRLQNELEQNPNVWYLLATKEPLWADDLFSLRYSINRMWVVDCDFLSFLYSPLCPQHHWEVLCVHWEKNNHGLVCNAACSVLLTSKPAVSHAAVVGHRQQWVECPPHHSIPSASKAHTVAVNNSCQSVNKLIIYAICNYLIYNIHNILLHPLP